MAFEVGTSPIQPAQDQTAPTTSRRKPATQPKNTEPLCNKGIDDHAGSDKLLQLFAGYAVLNDVMFSRSSKLLVVLALVCSIGLHWAVLQSVAWVGMIVSYSQQGNLHEAIARTFDGKHPCQLCKIVNEGQKAEKSQKAVKAINKLDLCNLIPPSFVHPALRLLEASRFVHLQQPRFEPPPSPPPRSLAVTL